jgi:UDP-glucose 4-epimerase
VNANPTREVLVTGGAGFIGSHTCVELLQHGYVPVVIDDHSNSNPLAYARIEQVTGTPIVAYRGDIRDAGLLNEVLTAHHIDAIIHFAAKKAVGESFELPLDYYSINVGGTIAVLEAMVRHGVLNLVFSSSCSIYGAAAAGRLDESAAPAPTNPYARSKWMGEQILSDACIGYPELHVLALRYFNPIGAHVSGVLGEDPLGIPNNVLPYISQAASGRRDRLTIFGDDYETPDGTGIRDYIHVMDVADGHRVALDRLADRAGLSVLNLGTGIGTSVLELVHIFESVSGRPVPFQVGPRRDGDVASLIADPGEAKRRWGWSARRSVEDACRDMSAFQLANPLGYASVEVPVEKHLRPVS